MSFNTKAVKLNTLKPGDKFKYVSEDEIVASSVHKVKSISTSENIVYVNSFCVDVIQSTRGGDMLVFPERKHS